MPRFKVAAIDSRGKGVVRHYVADDARAAMAMARLDMLVPESVEAEESPPTKPHSEPPTRREPQPPATLPTSAPVRRAGGMEHAPISTIAAGIMLPMLIVSPIYFYADLLRLIAQGGSDGREFATILKLTIAGCVLVLIGLVFFRALRGR